jgi:leucyl-tRNA synthetase
MQGFNVLFPWSWHFTGESIPGVSKRIANNDEAILRAIREIDGVPESEIKKFTDPIYLANYYKDDAINGVKSVGFSVDWRRQFTTIDEHFKKFVEWQYLTLMSKGYIVKGTHPVVYCPNCESPTGDHDRLEGEGVSPAEFMFLKFKLAGAKRLVLPAATLRLETVFGVTNMWLNPDVTYVKAEVDGDKKENWLLSKDCVEKLKYQGFKVKVLEEIKGSKLIGKNCINPVLKDKTLILPAKFVDPTVGSGVVMSVPSHAPYDYVALEELRNNPEQLKEYGIDPATLKDIMPISLIELEGFGEHPAIDICKKFGIKEQGDKRLEKATDEIYKKEFHQGVLRINTGKYAGKKVFEIKPQIVKDFIKDSIATRIYDLPESVVCRCTTKCVVKILKNQWFVKFSDKKWKKLAKQCIDQMKIYPDEARNWFDDIVDWLEDKACARHSGLGTALPWDDKWIVETLGDSTVYMAFYTIANLLKKHKIKPEELTKEVLDFIFLGKKLKSKKMKIWKEMRNSFLYWYPVDFRDSAKELIPNHLTFFIFHHTAIFPKKFWPRFIATNGMINIDGEKMSKSKGNFITLKQAIQSYGADATRFTLMNTSEGLADADFRKYDAELAGRTLSNFYDTVSRFSKMETRGKKLLIDKWLLSSLQRHIEEATVAYEKTKFKSTLQIAFFGVLNDVKMYMRRVDAAGKGIAKSLPKAWVRLVAPIIPHICEELWHGLGNKGFVSIADWPEIDKKLVDKKIEEMDAMFQQTVEDIRHVKRLADSKNKVTSAYLYFVTDKEIDYFKESLQFLKKEFNFSKVDLLKVSGKKIYDPQDKAKKAKYGKPGIYLE